MREYTVEAKDAGQRLNKYLHRILPAMPVSLGYRMLRKKNITLNGKKADGSESVKEGDRVRVFFSDETFAKFEGFPVPEGTAEDYMRAFREIEALYGRKVCTLPSGFRESAETGRLKGSGRDRKTDAAAGTSIMPGPVLYEDRDILIANKLPGILSQKASPGDVSMNEWLVGRCLFRREITEESLRSYRPSVCSRLDRNTEGILICAKTLRGSRAMTKVLRERTLHKYYRMAVKGTGLGSGMIEAYLSKDEKTNTVHLDSAPSDGASLTRTGYRTILEGPELSLIEAELITGKTHQLRAHFAWLGHPIAGDPKYGDRELNRIAASRFDVRRQLLIACRIVFPEMRDELPELSGREFEIPLPPVYEKIVREYRGRRKERGERTVR